MRSLCELVTRLARENAGWGSRRIIGELRKRRLRVGRPSVRRILKDAGLTPSPHRRGRAEDTVWRKFIGLRLNTMVACDFFAKNVLTPLGMRLAFTEHLGATAEECFFWATHSGAELDLLWVRGRRRWGFEFKRTSSPKLTSSLKTAIDALGLQRAFLVHAGDKSFPLHGQVTAVAAARLLDDVG